METEERIELGPWVGLFIKLYWSQKSPQILFICKFWFKLQVEPEILHFPTVPGDSGTAGPGFVLEGIKFTRNHSTAIDSEKIKMAPEKASQGWLQGRKGKVGHLLPEATEALRLARKGGFSSKVLKLPSFFYLSFSDHLWGRDGTGFLEDLPHPWADLPVVRGKKYWKRDLRGWLSW